MGFFDKIAQGLKKTRDSVSDALSGVFTGFSSIDDDFYDELEETLILSDMGTSSADEIIRLLKERVKRDHLREPGEARTAIKEIMAAMMEGDSSLRLTTKPSVILVIGVNGVGKTTSIAKIAHLLKGEGKKVILGAADTFRAAAIDQLDIWAKRAGVDIIKHTEGADPAAVVFDAVAAARARGADVLICDTAGRLHNKKNLMDELNKIFRVLSRELPDADLEVLLVLDATTGQNAVNQARQFKEAAPVTGIVLTKLDGTAKGAIILPIKSELLIPVKFVGVGEGMDDLIPFDGAQFVEAIFE